MKKLILILSMFLLTGCYDYNELNELELVSSIIVDYKDDKYEVNLEILNTSEKAEKGTYLLTGEGKSLEEAMNNVYFDSESLPYYSHMKALIVSDKVAEKGIENILEYLMRDALIRKDFNVFVTDDVDEILEYEPPKTESLGDKVQKITEANAENNGRYKTCIFREIIYHYLRDNNYLIGSVGIEDEEVTLYKSYVFIDNKMAFEVEDEVSLFDNMLYEGNKSFLVYGSSSFNIHEYSLERKIHEDKIVLTLKGSARILNAKGAEAFSREELRELEEKLNEKIEKQITDVIDYSKKKNEDIFNFNYFYYLHYPKLVKNDTWKNIEYEVNSELVISEKGLLLDSLGGNKNAK